MIPSRWTGMQDDKESMAYGPSAAGAVCSEKPVKQVVKWVPMLHIAATMARQILRRTIQRSQLKST